MKPIQSHASPIAPIAPVACSAGLAEDSVKSLKYLSLQFHLAAHTMQMRGYGDARLQDSLMHCLSDAPVNREKDEIKHGPMCLKVDTSHM